MTISSYSYGSLGANFKVIKTSDGTQVVSQTLTTNGNFSFAVAISTGYTVIADPTGNNTGSFSWKVTQP